MNTTPEFSLKDLENENESFRNSIGTMDSSGKRQWVYPKRPPKRKYYKYRTIVSYILLAILAITPFIKIGGNPLFKFDILKREFFIFTKPFFPSDFLIFAVAAITTIIFVTLFTVIYGRIFCGWVCPQTIFLEMVFRKIEYAIEGDRNKQMRLDRQKWDEEKIRKRLLKWFIYAVISFIISNIFLAWIIGSDALINLIKEGPLEHSGTFVGLLIFTAVFYFVFAWFREQACTLVCPYGRLQGVLIDKKTLVVAYDYKRGEGEKGRGKFRKTEDRKAVGKGDCIDCGQCVAVCPTGIDIRNGTQLECVNCTACMDACDEIMERIDLPEGLIRYASEDNLAKQEKFKFTPRMIAYSAVLLLLIVITSTMVFTRTEVQSKFLRKPGSKFQVENNSVIVNEYEFMLINKTNEERLVHFQLTSHEGEIVPVMGPNNLKLIPAEIKQGKVKIKIDEKYLKKTKEKIQICIYNEDERVVDTYEINFPGPYNLSY